MGGRRRWLILATPLLLTGCGSILNFAPNTYGNAATPAPTPGDSWVVVVKGTPTPSVRPAMPRRSPTPSPTLRLLPHGGPAARPTPAPTCTDVNWRIGEINSLDVVPGPGTARVNWVHAGGADLIAYRLTAISQDLVPGEQRDVGWVTVVPTAPCAELTATLTGLDRRTAYTFSLDAVFTRKNGNGTRASTVARALLVSTT